jgi:hypothetical protein
MKKQPKRKYGIGGDRFVTEVRGRQFFVLDADSGLVMGGPFPSREKAQEKADQLNANLGRLGRHI